ncbi:hypothetical protein [Qipengyuania sp.]|uniref:hypothetical protein n=1 Tax=Qipengyuania sp. TaxID=2004515 RepID=UPI0035C866E7
MARNSTQVRPSLEQQLDAQVDALDGLLAEVRLGVRNQRHFDELEESAVAIGTGLRDAFRTAPRP